MVSRVRRVCGASPRSPVCAATPAIQRGHHRSDPIVVMEPTSESVSNVRSTSNYVNVNLLCATFY
jgi:hypothetical protein